MQTLSEKIKKIWEEGVGTEGTGKELVSSESDLSGTEKTSKMTKKYNKSTKQDKLPDNTEVGSTGTDERASSDNEKIKKEYKNPALEKLKAESFEAIFDGEELTEEFKTKAEAIFEATVAQLVESQVAAQIESLQEEHQLQLDEAVEEVKGELIEQIDGYLDFVVEQWMEDNAIALESGIKTEMNESFMEGLKKLFEDHYIDVPEGKLDVVEEQAAQIAVLNDELVALSEEVEKAVTETQVLKCEAVIAEHADGLSAMEAEKLASLAENVEFDTEEEFGAKVKALRESFFRKSTQSEDESQEGLTETKETKNFSDVSAVLEVLRKKDGLKLIRSSN